MEYLDFLKRKELKAVPRGIRKDWNLSSKLFPHQQDVVNFMLESGRGAPFLDTGLGKTAVELEYGRQVVEFENKPVLLLAPLAVGKQHDASFCRVGMPEYVLVFRKWAKEGEEDLVRPVLHPKTKVPLICWQELASEFWPDSMPHAWNYARMQSGQGDYDMPTTDVLNVRLARDQDAEKHLCPMPLNITKRALSLWTNAGDVVFSPFGGIGSEGMASITMGRKFIGTELHPTYYREAIKHLQSTDKSGVQDDMFEVFGIAQTA